jgi:excinuclease ABC subunit A
VVPDDRRSLKDGAVQPWAGASSPYYDQTLESLARHYKVALTTPWADLPKPVQQGILHGTGQDVVTLKYKDGLRAYEVKKPFEGVIPNLQRRFRETDTSGAGGPDALPGRSPLPRLQRPPPEARVTLGEGRWPAHRRGQRALHSPRPRLVRPVYATLTPQRQEIARRILKEIEERLQFPGGCRPGLPQPRAVIRHALRRRDRSASASPRRSAPA